MTIKEIDLWVSIEQILTPEEFKIFKMKHRFKMTDKQIAKEFYCKRRTVTDHIEQIHLKLRQLL